MKISTWLQLSVIQNRERSERVPWQIQKEPFHLHRRKNIVAENKQENCLMHACIHTQ